VRLFAHPVAVWQQCCSNVTSRRELSHVTICRTVEKKQKIILSRDKLSQRRACGRDPPRKKVNMQIVAEKSLWAGPTGEKRKKIRACGLCLRLEFVACCLRPTPDRHYALSRIGRLMVELLSITESHAFKLQKLWSSRVSQF
jgi:hypothetical protein